MVTAQGLDIRQENLNCHHILLIQDVINSTFNNDDKTFINGVTDLTFRKARVNGLIVAQKSLLSSSNEYHVWLDDGTGVIRVILSAQMMKRNYADRLIPPTSVTLFGRLEKRDTEETVLICGGFKVEEDCIAEMYHMLKAIQDRPTKINLSQEQKNMFYTLSSQPSPERKLKTNFLESPMRDDDINSQNAGFLWSPDHKFATSTPMRAAQEITQGLHSQSAVPTPTRLSNAINFTADEDDEFGDIDDDEFDHLDSIDLLALEKDAVAAGPTQERDNETIQLKRKFELVMDD